MRHKSTGKPQPVYKKNFRRVISALFLALILVWVFLPKPELMENISTSQAIYSEDLTLLRLTLSKDDKYRLFLSHHQIPQELIEAFLLKEDKYFYWHKGFNPVSLLRATWETFVSKNTMGASTLTMQLARIRYGLNTKTIGGKFYQIFKAIQIERHYSKKEILEAYLNLTPMGRNIEGVGAASLIYFGKSVDQLNLPEILTLAVIPQSPQKRIAPAPLIPLPQGEREISGGGIKGAGENPLQTARSNLFKIWIKKHPQDKNKTPLFSLPLSLKKPEHLPFLAPHFVNGVIAENETPIIITTLNLSLQEKMETLIKNSIRIKKNYGIKNAAALLLDTRTMEIKAAVGSGDFFNAEIEGQVDGTKAKRSPGSALKPFLYGLAIDKGLIHPLTLLKDTPTSFAGYDPENFDNEFEGPISAHDALIKSRNIPAVFLANKLTNTTIYEWMQKAEISGLREKSFYGLSTALGGAEVTMEEMAKLYAMLANGGVMKQLVKLKSYDGALVPGALEKSFPTNALTHDRTSAPIPLLSPESAFMILDILKDNPPPEPYEKQTFPLPVAWKTGTSFAFRDAWAAGVVGPYVLITWVGNFSGKGDPTFIGRSAAGPLFFQIVESLKIVPSPLIPLPQGARENKTPSPLMGESWGEGENLTQTDVCPLSGGIPGPSCPRTVKTWFIPGVSPIKPCEIHQTIFVDNKTGLRACSENDPDSHAEVFEFWPSDLKILFKIAGVPRKNIPPYHPRCNVETKSSTGIPPQILSPQGNLTYIIRTSKAETEKITFKASASADVEEIYWFVDESFAGLSKPTEPFFWKAQAGPHTVTAVDTNGLSATQKINVVSEK